MAWRLVALACLLASLVGCSSGGCESFGTYHVGANLTHDGGYYQSCEADLSAGGKVARYAFGDPCDATGRVQPVGDSPAPSYNEASRCRITMLFARSDHLAAYLGDDRGTMTVTCDGRIVYESEFTPDEAC